MDIDKISMIDPEVNDYLDVFNLDKKTYNLANKIKQNLKFKRRSLQAIYYQHAKHNWNIDYFIQHIATTPPKDWQRYSNSFYSELYARLGKRKKYDIQEFVTDYKEFSVILGNWIFNSHLARYGLRSPILNKSIVIYFKNKGVVNDLFECVYHIMRDAGCRMIPRTKENPFFLYPFRPRFDSDLEPMETPEQLIYHWGKEFNFIHYDSYESEPFLKLKKAICRRDSDYFYSRLPLIIAAPYDQDFMEGKKQLVEFIL